MGTPLRAALSRLVGWLADRRIPGPLRAPIFRAYAAATGADLSEMRVPLQHHGSLGAFFVRRLREGARPFETDPAVLPSPADGTLQSVDEIERGTILQAKGRPYAVAELLGDATLAESLEGGRAWTIYLGPRDYHRVHAPLAGRLLAARWMDGARRSVHPRAVARHDRLLATNERCVMRLETELGPLVLVMVGALNVGRIRLVGVPPGQNGPLPSPRRFERGEELARFELGSTVVLLAPLAAGLESTEPRPGEALRMGRPLARVARGSREDDGRALARPARAGPGSRRLDR